MLDAKVTRDFFTNPEDREVFEFILSHWKEYGQVPGSKVVKSNFPTYRLIDGREPYEYYLDEVRRRRKYGLVFETLAEATELLEDDELDAAEGVLAEGLLRAQIEVSELRDTNIIDTWEKRLETYREWKTIGRILRGIPSGFPTLDEGLQGFQSEQLITFVGAPKAGKAHPLDTRVMTPQGWRPIGDLQPGDAVIGSSGFPTLVRAVHDWGPRPVLRLSTSDGRSVRVSAEHEWTARPRSTRRWRDMETSEIAAALAEGTAVHLPVSLPVQRDAVSVPLDPYALGLLLGDGGFSGHNLSFTNSDGLEEFLPFDMTPTRDDRNQWGLHNPARNILKGLGLLGKKSTEKFVPEPYLYGSVAQRKALLAGLLDTDGGVEGRSTVYGTSSPRLRDAVVEIVRSLGGTARVTSKTPTYDYRGERRTGSEAYAVRIRLPFNPFRLRRKFDALQDARTPRDIVLAVSSVEETGKSEPMRCITVAAPDGLYVTEDYLLTHNSWMMLKMAMSAHDFGRTPLFIGFEMSNEEQEARHDALAAQISYSRLLKGTYTEEEWDKLQRALKRRRSGDPFIFGSDPEGATVSSIASKIEQYRPDIVFIDGAYMMEDEGKDAQPRGTPQALTNVTRALKRLARQRRIPIVISTQVLLWKINRKKGLDEGAIGYTSSFIQDSDVVLGVETPGEDTNSPIKRMKVVLGRTVPKFDVNLYWNWEELSVEEMTYDPSEGGGSFGVESEGGPKPESDPDEDVEEDTDKRTRKFVRRKPRVTEEDEEH